MLATPPVVTQDQSWAPPPPSYSQPPPSYTPPPAPKKRSALPWVIGIVAVIGLLIAGGVGLIGLLAYIGMKSDEANKNAKPSSSPIAKSSPNVNRSTTTNANSDVVTSTEADANDDFSTQKWSVGSDSMGTFAYKNGELHVNAVPGRYVVEYAPKETAYYTKDATVTMSARSVDGTSPRYGYGVVVHGQLSSGNQLEDYGFLVRTDDNPSYAIVLHKGGKETYLHDWTPSTAVLSGNASNELEIKTKGPRLEFYVNGQYLAAIQDSAGFKTGRVGVYTSDSNEVAFDDLKVTHN